MYFKILTPSSVILPDVLLVVETSMHGNAYSKHYLLSAVTHCDVLFQWNKVHSRKFIWEQQLLHVPEHKQAPVWRGTPAEPSAVMQQPACYTAVQAICETGAFC